MDLISTIDYSLFPQAERFTQMLLSRTIGGDSCRVYALSVPPGGGSPTGTHMHKFDKFYFCLSGTMDVEVEDQQFKAAPGTLIWVPKGAPHRNWNGGSEKVVHLAVLFPQMADGEPVTHPV